MQFSFNVNINIGVTPQLADLLGQLIATPKNAEVKRPEGPAPVEIKPIEPAAIDPSPVESIPVKAKPKRPASEEIREIMHQTRVSFEGEDYQNRTDSAEYKKYHKALNAQFKGFAALLGYDKPSLLPDDKVESFRDMCDALIIGEDGLITSAQAPF